MVDITAKWCYSIYILRNKEGTMKNLFTAAVVLGLVGFGANAGYNAMMLPDVHFSYSKDHCVKVINYTDEQFDCSNYPAKFNHVWVK